FQRKSWESRNRIRATRKVRRFAWARGQCHSHHLLGCVLGGGSTMVICAGTSSTISGCPRNSLIVPRTRTFAPGSALVTSPPNAESKSVFFFSNTAQEN